jgi:hypothetical protein
MQSKAGLPSVADKSSFHLLLILQTELRVNSRGSVGHQGVVQRLVSVQALEWTTGPGKQESPRLF